MKTIEIDCRNLECPAPVMKTKMAAEDMTISRIRVLVDNEAALENVSRFLSMQNFQVSVDSGLDVSLVEGIRQGSPEIQSPMQETFSAKTFDSGGKVQHTMILISSDHMGDGDDVLGKKLMINFIKTVPEMGEELWKMAFVNSGVRLTVSGSPVLSELQNLEASGVDILVCGACMNHFGILDAKAVGTTTNMLDIVTSMQVSQKIITL